MNNSYNPFPSLLQFGPQLVTMRGVVLDAPAPKPKPKKRKNKVRPIQTADAYIEKEMIALFPRMKKKRKRYNYL